jgi:phage terminase large subunit
MEKNTNNIKLNINPKIFNDIYLNYPLPDGRVINLLDDYKTRTMVFYGGGGSGKSKFAVQRTVLKCLRLNGKRKRKVLVVRNVLNTVRDSVFAEFKACISEWGLSSFVRITESYLTIEFANGSEILFKGMDDEEKIKSIQGITDIFVEEATEIDLDKYDQLHIRLRNKKAGFNQIVLCYNPIGKDNWVYPHFHEQGKPLEENCVVAHTNYTHNRFLPQENIDRLLELKRTNPFKYKVYALGEFASLGKGIYENFTVREFDEYELRKQGIKCYFGVDFGYTNDPSTLVKVYVDEVNKKMYIADEMYQKGMLNKEIFQWIQLRGYQGEIITADSSEPKSIEEIKRLGIRRMKGARKGKDSILHGIQFIQAYEIIVHPRCKNAEIELQNYTWKKDKTTNEYVNTPEDKYNHLLDALRYAVEDIMPRNRLKPMASRMLGL